MQARQGRWNGRLGEAELAEGLRWSGGAQRLREALEGRTIVRRTGLTAVSRIAATICDLRGGEGISEADLLEALHYSPPEALPPGSAVSASAPEVNSSAMP